MSSLLAELSERASHLPPEERAQLAEGLLESLQEPSRSGKGTALSSSKPLTTRPLVFPHMVMRIPCFTVKP